MENEIKKYNKRTLTLIKLLEASSHSNNIILTNLIFDDDDINLLGLFIETNKTVVNLEINQKYLSYYHINKIRRAMELNYTIQKLNLNTKDRFYGLLANKELFQISKYLLRNKEVSQIKSLIFFGRKLNNTNLSKLPKQVLKYLLTFIEEEQPEETYKRSWFDAIAEDVDIYNGPNKSYKLGNYEQNVLLK